MTEIEKMFENANVYKMLCNCEFKNLYDYRIEYGSDVCDYTESNIKEPCKVCEKAKQKIKYYPDFTADKQLLLIQWLAKTRPIHINFLLDKWTIEGTIRYGIKYDTFEDALSGYINQIWQGLTDQEKEEIRGILNE